MGILDIAALQGMTPAELEALTKGEIIAAIVGDQDKTECTKSVDGPNGQVSRVYETKDALGVPLKTEQWDWKVDGVLKAVPVVIKEILPIEEVVTK